ncbi:MAG: ABC transporter permease [Coriobacteriia bacterium]|nr:ABC transporter permease [Coriobacteriia bacterium]
MRWLHIGLKDIVVTTRDRSALGVLLVMPIVLILILGSALGDLAANLEKTPIAIVNLDEGRMGAEITDGFFTEADLTRLFLAKRMRDPIVARGEVERGDLAGVIVVPPDLTRRLNTGKPAQLTIYIDPGRQISGAVFRGVTEAVSTRVSAASVAARTSAYYLSSVRTNDPSFMAVTIGRAVQSASASGALDAVSFTETTAVRGEEISTLTYYAAGMSVMFIMFGSMFGAFSLLSERDDWTLARIMTTPTTRTDIVGGKMLGVLFVGLAQFGILWGFTTVIGVRWGDPMAVGLLAVATVVAATGLSILIAAIGKTVRSVSGIAQFFIQFMAAVGGSFFPVAQFPAWLQPLHYASVNGWAIDGMLESMRGGTALDVLPNVTALLVMGIVFFVVGAARLRWE